MDAQGNGIAGPVTTAIAGGADSGRPARDSLFLSAQLSIAGNAARDVRVRNLSERGLMAELPEPVEPGTAVALELRGIGQVSGRVAWYAEGRAGIALDREIDPTRARRRIGTRAR